jgi:hypothetical protein
MPGAFELMMTWQKVISIAMMSDGHGHASDFRALQQAAVITNR